MNKGKREPKVNNLFPDLQVSVNPALERTNNNEVSKKVATAKRVLSKANLDTILKLSHK